MADPIEILSIVGSLRKASYNKGALRAAQTLCPDDERANLADETAKKLIAQPLQNLVASPLKPIATAVA